ncbi:DUF6387 family protein [Burkholderia pyrrocinia]|uniref:DUF6387 family protein n=1 Tax=Burkholderia pyrrocinia TaxID=60550 RepID=A0ABZ3BDB7_BURPY
MKVKRAQYSDLPSGLDVEKYDVCFQWKLGDWVANIFHRLIRQSSIDDNLSDSAYIAMMQEATDEVFDSPELNYGHSEEGAIDADPSSPPAVGQRVRDMSVLDVLRLRDYFDDAVFSKYTTAYSHAVEAIDVFTGRENPDASDSAFEAATLVSDTPEWVMTKECLGEDFRFSPFAVASVDLEAPDDELVEHFLAWVASARANRGIEPLARSFTKADLQLWSEMRVLTYIDLTLWAKARNLRISATVMGRALFPSEFDVGLEDRVRKVVAREATRLMSMTTLRLMQSQHIKAEQKNQKVTPDS